MNTLLSTVALVVALIVLSSSTCSGQAAPEQGLTGGFVTREGAKLFLDGKEYRAFGVNVPNLHQSYAGFWHHDLEIYGSLEKARQAMIDAVKDAGRHDIAFIRFFASPGYPVDMDKLYFTDRARYWSTMDEVFDLCRENNVRLIPSLGSVTGWFSYCAEPKQAILDPKSKTWKMTHDYVRQFVTRYKDDPVVLMWELENEVMLGSDVDAKGQPLLNKGLYSPGAKVRRTGTREDSLRWDMILRIYREQAAFIKGLDPNHLVTSGDASVRPECTCRRETFPDFKWRNDTLREFLANNIASQPEPLDVYSFHVYGTLSKANRQWIPWGISSMDNMRCLIRAAHSTRSPVFIGEFGQHEPKLGEDPEAAWALAAIDVIEEEEVSLTALWVWHFLWQPDLTVESATHPKLVERMAEFNRKYAGLK